MKSSRLAWLIPAIALTTLALDIDAASALPRYAARYEQGCNLCHTNPTGGGQRTLYASQFLVPTEMVLDAFEMEELDSISPQVSESILVGVDLRTLYTGGDPQEDAPHFFQMQNALSVSVQASEQISLYMNRGTSSTYEAFGTAYVLPATGYVKLGRFVPPFGWRFADHTAFTRDVLGFFPPAHTDVGVELGINPGRSSLTLAVLNGAQGSTRESDDRIAVSTRGLYRLNISGIALGVGGSWYTNSARRGPLEETVHSTGPFGYLRWDRFSWLAELDWSFITQDGPGSDDRTAIVTSHELSWQLKPGLDLLGTYSFHDPDLDFTTGARSRVGLGVDSLLNPFVGVRAVLNRYENEAPEGGTDEDWVQAEVMVHFLY